MIHESVKNLQQEEDGVALSFVLQRSGFANARPVAKIVAAGDDIERAPHAPELRAFALLCNDETRKVQR